MKGIAIYESPFMGETYVRAVGISHADYTFEAATTEDASVSLSGYFSISSQAKCAKEDTYDFETGALIALMRMCGKGKTEKAYLETFFKGGDPGDCPYYQICKEPTIKRLEDANKYLLSESAQRLRDKINLKGKNVALKAENEKLKLDCEKLQKGYLDTDMIFCGGRQNGKQYTFLVDLFKKIDQKKVDAAYKEAYNTKLPLWQKEVLNGLYGFHKESKEKTELPRTLDINGIIYRKSIQIKDFGEQITKLAEESSTKPWFTTQPENFSFEIKHVDSDVLDILRGCQKKPDVSKREKMWDYILAPGRTSIYVKAEDVADFLDECTIVGVTWITGVAPNKQRPYFSGEGVYFSINSSKSKRGAKEFRHVMSWRCTACPDEVQADVHYIRPMRWDLFEKGRIVIGVRKEHYDEFKKEITRHFGLVNQSKPYDRFNYSFFIFDKNAIFIEAIGRSQFRQLKELNNHKVVYWEDVR